PVEILTFTFPASPHPNPLPIERLQDCILSSLLSHVSVGEFPVSLGNLVSHLHSHGALGQRPNQRFECFLCAVPSVIVVIESIQPNGLISGDEAAVGPNYYVVEIVSDRQ